MGETTLLRKFGNSLGVWFDKGVLEKVYGLKEGDEIRIEYNINRIILIPKAEAQV